MLCAPMQELGAALELSQGPLIAEKMVKVQLAPPCYNAVRVYGM